MSYGNVRHQRCPAGGYKEEFANCLECGARFKRHSRFKRFCPNCGPHAPENKHNGVPRQGPGTGRREERDYE